MENKDKLKCKVVMLVSDHTSPIIKSSVNGELILDGINCKSWFAGHYQHLYFTSDHNDVTENDWFYDEITNKVFLADSTTNFQYLNSLPSVSKVEATSDSSLNLPLIPQSFITKFVESQGTIKEVMIEMNVCEKHKTLTTNVDAHCTCVFGPQIIKLRKDGTVIVSRVKDSWTRDEIAELIYLYKSTNTYFKVKDSMSLTQYIKEWIEEHL